MLSVLSTLFDLALVVIGFSLIILIHELGHFLAARWAGIRVLAFSLGFGPAIVSYRRGFGVQRGSSEEQYVALQERRLNGEFVPELAGVSPTEYRWNVLPLGGYVKMLGQDDADPTARSGEPDSYQSASVWKRMVVISAGVIFNVLAAVALFMIVFTVGLRTEAPVIGDVARESPAATAVASNAAALGVTRPGLQPGDRVLSLNGAAPDSFKDITIAAAMAAKGSTVQVRVERAGVPEPLQFDIEPKPDRYSKLLDLGVRPASAPALIGGRFTADERELLAKRLTAVGLPGVQPGMRLTGARVEGTDPLTSPQGLSPHALVELARASQGRPLTLTFSPAEGMTGAPLTVDVPPRPELPIQEFVGSTADAVVAVPHLLGLLPVMRVDDVDAKFPNAKILKPGDVFARLGDLEWPNMVEGMAEIRRASAGRGDQASIPVSVYRHQAEGGYAVVDLGELKIVNRRIGIAVGAADDLAIVARWPNLTMTNSAAAGATDQPPLKAPSGSLLALTPGSRILSVNDTPVNDLADVRAALVAAAASGPTTVSLEVQLPVPGAELRQRVAWPLSTDEAKALAQLSWLSPIGPADFEPLEVVLKGQGPLGAVTLGLRETNRVMLSTYITFLRLFQGTVKVEHLKGPVGIAHVGTLIADRGFIWLMFFLAVISINLAVINFLPLPIVDGGHMVFLIYEAIVGKPVSVAVQNVATMAGLVLVASLFLLVTYNDLANLLLR